MKKMSFLVTLIYFAKFTFRNLFVFFGYYLSFILLLAITSSLFSQCVIQATVCQPGTAGPFNFTPTSGSYAGGSFANAGCATGNSGNHSYGFIRLYINQSGPLNLLINGNATTGFIDVAIFNIPNGQNPCTAIQSASNAIGCNFASAASGCVQFGNAFPCPSTVPAPNVTAGQEIVIIAQNWSNPGSSTFTLQLGPGAQSGLPNTTITPIPPICQSASPIQLQSQSGGGVWSGPGISSSGLFNPNTAGVGTHTISYSLGQTPCQSTSTTSITVLPNNNTTFNQINPICQFDTPPILPTQSQDSPSIIGVWSPSTINTTTPGNVNYVFTPNSGQCANPYTMTIQITNQQTPSFNQIPPLCQFDNLVILPIASNNTIPITGNWNPATVDSNIPGNFTFNFTPNPNQCALPTSMTVTVNPQIIASFTQISPTCQNGITPILPSTSLNNVVGAWSPSTININSPGTTTYSFTPNNGVCTLGTDMDITIIPIVPPTITSDLTQGCAPLDVVFSSTSTLGSDLRWYINANQISNLSSFNFLFSTEGCYNVSLSSENQGCIETVTVDSMICVQNAPNVSFSANPNVFNNSPQFVNFLNNTDGNNTYYWDFGDDNFSTELSPTHLYTNINSSKNVTLTATTTFGCTGTSSIFIPYQDNTMFYIPNSFTPDEDQFNQTWGPVFTTGFDPYNFDLYIFNRWGDLVWESHNDKAKWDGTYGKKGFKAPSGLYIYKISYKPLDTDERIIITGHINLMR
jgi:gliding motility-associated-like protein